jgi:macrolide-specific efflux system membrane fusion protein
MSSSVKGVLAGALAAALLLLPLSGCGGKKAPPAPELLEPKGVTLDTAEVRRGSIQTVATYEGLVLPAVRELSFTVSGVMTDVNVCAGSRVKAGQELASLDVSRYTSALESMESYLAFAEENEAIIEREQEIQIELARLALAEQRSAGAGRNTLRLAELKIKEQENSLTETCALWELDRAEQLSSIEEVRAIVDSSILLAPCDGTIVSCSAKDGAYAMENMGVICLAEDAELYLSVAAVSAASLSEADEVYATVAGKRVEVTPRPYGEAYMAQPGMSAFDVTDRGDVPLESGMVAVLFVISDRVEDALIVPSSAVHYDYSYYVYKIVDGVQVRQSVQIGVANDAEVQILSGLQEGDVVYAGT